MESGKENESLRGLSCFVSFKKCMEKRWNVARWVLTASDFLLLLPHGRVGVLAHKPNGENTFVRHVEQDQVRRHGLVAPKDLREGEHVTPGMQNNKKRKVTLMFNNTNVSNLKGGMRINFWSTRQWFHLTTKYISREGKFKIRFAEGREENKKGEHFIDHIVLKHVKDMNSLSLLDSATNIKYAGLLGIWPKRGQKSIHDEETNIAPKWTSSAKQNFPLP